MTGFMKVLSFAFLTVMVSVGAYSQSPKHAPDFTLKLSTAKETIPALRSGERLTIDVEEKNISQHPVNLGRNKADLPYQMSVLRNGLPAETTEEYRRITNPNPIRTPNADPGVMLFMLDPGESKTFHIVLTDYFDMSQPGYYEISFSRGTDQGMADNVEVKSNTLTVTVLPASSTPAYSQTSQQPFTINISTDKQTVEAGSDVYIRIKLTNTSDQAVDCTSWYTNALDRRYIYDVLDENGKSVAIPGDHPELGGGSIQFCELAPRDSTNTGSRLTTLYDFTKPGQYTVQVSRYIGKSAKEGVVKSNIITITVLPAPPPPAQQ